ncbi:protein kinase [Pseudenhygromyxa sp. WMMC2535]|uniref:serine/threonine-protein kinase n=1 Tax=Pseudenhygromyxa sp. WMMC2535 TaxID=2712867 RepID=UPI00155167C9|nr:serine/threonine-protein kinase [Pseudenhygromyxa sp. WMMC2535]NVB41339.1 protein kinase [Pseudenhygromyxa sp. WMMC2535]
MAKVAPRALARELARDLAERDAHCKDPSAYASTLPRAATTSAKPPAAKPLRPDLERELDRDPDTPEQIGRYLVLRRLGAGGMGVVYMAYDALLDRKLAIKLLHERVWDIDGRRRERLLREAQAMARVTHPNVVIVHEVGAADEQLFVAMEFVPGLTVKEWLELRPRPWREIVAIFRQAADGLAAIHEAGLVHRDVKPANLIIGDDGRVRVLDLGLVGTEPLAPGPMHPTHPDDSSPGELSPGHSSPGHSSPGHSFLGESALRSSSSNWALDNPLTRTGERLGTPTYMSREQFMGLELTPASDIFSLCVALFEALYGVHPFKTTSYLQLQRSVIDGRVSSPPSSTQVPSWLHALVLRGLAPRPKDRPASMRALSSALAKDPRRTQRIAFAAVAGAALMASAGAGLALAHAPAGGSPSCSGTEQVITSAWNPERAAEVQRAFEASERAYAGELGRRVQASLDEYASTWANTHRRACNEHALGVTSSALLDARMACLDQRRRSLAETVSLLLTADTDVVAHAGQMVAKLPRVSACDELASLRGDELSLSRDPLATAQRAQIEGGMIRAQTLANAGRLDEAERRFFELSTEAAAHGQPGLEAQALLHQAEALELTASERSSARAALEHALAVAIEHDIDALAAEAMIRRIYMRGLGEDGSKAALADIPLAEAMLTHAGGDPELRALLLNNAGVVRLSAGDRGGARADIQRALALKEQLFDAQHLELAPTLANLGLLTDEPELRARIFERTIAIYERRLGPAHPRTLDARLLAAVHAEDPARASEALDRLCPQLEHGDAAALFVECAFARARVEYARGRQVLAHAAMSEALEALALEGAPDDPRRLLAAAYLRLSAPPDPARRPLGATALTPSLTDSLPLDSLPPNSLPPNSLPPNSLPLDSLPPNSLPPNSLPTDSSPSTASPSAPLLDRAQLRDALHAQLHASLEREPNADWWMVFERAELRTLLAELALADRDPDAAAESFRGALVELDSIQANAPSVELQRLLARARAGLALALTALADRDGALADRDGARASAEAARAYYSRWPRAYASRLSKLDPIFDTAPSPPPEE